MSSSAKALIIGDSISIGYTPHVARLLRGRAAVSHHEGNCGDTRNVLEHLAAWLAADADATLIHFNVGLHDLRTWHRNQRHQVPLDEYWRNLTEIVRRLLATGKTLVWASTTPTHDERNAATGAEFYRVHADVLAYNEAAREVAGAAGIPMNDLHAVVWEAGLDECLSADGVHMTEGGYALLGQAVSQAIAEYLPP